MTTHNMASKGSRYYAVNDNENVDLRSLIPQLCNQFYHLGWISASGGAMSIKDSDGKIYVTPSGVQKERLKPGDLFVCDDEGNITESPDKSEMAISGCTELFLLAYKHRGARAVMHTHSKAAFMASVVFPGNEVKLTHMEMIRGITNDKTKKKYEYEEELVIPVIENRLTEMDLVDPLEEAMLAYPETPCVLVRRHGIYVWGESWERTKIMCECYDYLFDMAVQMKLHGIDPSLKPV